MLVIHGVWAHGALCLWAEDPELPDAGPGSVPSAVRLPRPHPFACQAAELADLVAGWPGAPDGLADAARKAVHGELILPLPTAGGGPLASPELVRPASHEATAAGRPARRGRVSLASWKVPVLAFGPAAALTVLAALGGSGQPDAPALAGGSLGYLATVARFAAGLAARGRLLPVLVAEDGTLAARWRPVLGGADVQRARDLAAAMPPSCRAAGGPGDGAPGALLGDALEALTDAAARSRLPVPLLPARRGRAPARLPVAERYVLALTAPDPRIEIATTKDEDEAAGLAADLDAWRDGAQIPAGPVRTCFRLAEPAEPDRDPWRVEFALQSADDPSLMVSAADVWAGLGAGMAPDGDPEEELLAGLGAAARLFAEMEDALREAAPAQVEMDTSGAFRFLRETGPLLAGAGFGVLLPDWVRRARLGLKLTTRSRSSAGSTAAGPGAARFGLGDIVDFKYDIAVGDEALDPEELAELARLKVPLVRLRGQWVELDDAHLKAALKFLERNPAGTMTAADALAAGLGLAGPQGPDDPDDEVPLVGVDADGWLGDLISGQADRRLEPLTTPAGFRGELRPYQERGLSWLSFLGGLGLGGILADDMGLGKTIQLLSLISAQPPGSGPTLLVCPMSLVGNWQREAARFTPDLRVHVHHGADRLAGEELAAALGHADLVLTTYGVAARDQAALSQVSWSRLVVDEAQNIKNHATRQARAIRGLPATARIALTGTPVENRLSELWSIMEFANPGLLGPAEKFRKRYAVPIERHDPQEEPDAVQALKRITQPFVLRRLKTDKTIISDLPDKLEMKVFCNLTAEQASLYQATVSDMLSRIEDADSDISRRGLVLATMAKLKQVCNHPAHLLGDGSRLPGRSGKLARLEEICDEIVAEGDKALCFTQYAEFGRMLQPHLAARLGCPVLFLHGGTAKKQRDAMVAQFGELDEPALFLLSLKAGGTGLNLTAASHVIHVDRWWNPAVEDQATDRAFRIGQRRNVQVRKFVCVGTLEERIDAMIEDKKALAEQIVGTGESWLTELSAEDLRSVLTLSPDAVSE